MIFDIDSQKTDQITGMQSIHLQPIQLYRRNFSDSDAANIRIGQRDTAQPGSEELRIGKAAFGKGDLLETALRKGSAGEVAAGEAHVPHARLRKTCILRTAALRRNMLQRRLRERSSREAASGETATRDGKMVAGKSRDVTVPEGTAGDLLFADKKIGRLYRQGRTGKLRFGDFDLGIHKIQTSMQPSSRRIERLSGAPPAIEPTIRPASASSDRTYRSRRRSSSRRRAYL